MESLREGAHNVYMSVVYLDPCILNHGGRPKGYVGANDPGELSGVVWCVYHFDVNFHTDEGEEGLTSIDSFEAVTRTTLMQQYVNDFEKAYASASTPGSIRFRRLDWSGGSSLGRSLPWSSGRMFC